MKIIEGLPRQLPKDSILITDEKVANLHGHHFNLPTLTIPPGERSKTRETKAYIEDELLKMGAHRKSHILALGGGVVSDLAGFVAATYMRGISWSVIPTTLLAMVDAAIGGKVAVNTPLAKNAIGAFHIPECVYLYEPFLKTLPESQLFEGRSEMLKHALIATPADDSIRASMQVKLDVIAKDPLERGYRRILNFGHTLAHALEIHSDHAISHGHAVALGMLFDLHLSDIEPPKELIEHLHRFASIEFPPFEELLPLMARDKKGLRFVLLKEIGKPRSFDGAYCTSVEPTKLERCYAHLCCGALAY